MSVILVCFDIIYMIFELQALDGGSGVGWGREGGGGQVGHNVLQHRSSYK